MKKLLFIILSLASFSVLGQSYGNHTTARFTTLTGILKANGTSNLSTITDGTSGQVLTTDGAGSYTFQNGGSASFGSQYQIPLSNAAGDDFDYVSTFAFDGANFTAGNAFLYTTTGIGGVGTYTDLPFIFYRNLLEVGRFNSSDQFEVADLSGTGTRFVTATSGGILGNATTIAGNYTLSGDYTLSGTNTFTTAPTFSTALGVPSGGTGTTSFTSGGVLFGASTAAIATDPDIFWDNSNKRLGIGINTPATDLHIEKASGETTLRLDNVSSTTARMLVGSGYAGIGTYSDHPFLFIQNSVEVGRFLSGGALTLNSSVAATTLNTGQGDNELYDMNQNVQTTDAVTFATVNTGQGANELYAMNQNVRTTDDVDFDEVSASGGVDAGNTGVFSKTVKINIGDWNTSSGGSIGVSHSLGTQFINIVDISAMIINDASTVTSPLLMDSGAQINTSSTTVTLIASASGGPFNNTSYDDGTSFNRGYIYITYTTTCSHTVCP